MLGMGWPEMGLIAVVAMLVFGPERLPGMARQAGSFVRTAKRALDQAKDDLGRELGHDLSGVDLKDLDPRAVVRRAIEDDPTPPS